MMGRTHYATGIAAGAWCAWGARVLLVPGPVSPAAVVGVAAGAAALTWVAGRAAYWPDLDHAGSTAAKKAGWVTGLLSAVVSRVSCDVYDLTATDQDRVNGNFRDHRGLTHTALAAVLFGAVVGLLVWQMTLFAPQITWGVSVGAVTAWAASELYQWTRMIKAPRDVRRLARALSRIYPVIGLVVGGCAWYALPVPPAVELGRWAWVLAAGVGVSISSGMLAHDLGDAATKTGVPLLWPLVIKGCRYYPVHIRPAHKLTKTSAKSPTERRVRIGSWALAGVAALGWLPGFYLLVIERVLDLLA